jgi:hypothetical protein
VKPTVVITLEALPSEIPVAARVRSLLKTALRRDRLRCVRIGGDALADAQTTPEPSEGVPAAQTPS